LNILVVTDGFVPEHTGGISKSLHTEVLELAARGHRVRVLTRRHGRDVPEREQLDGFEIVRHPGPPKGTRAYYAHPFITMRIAPKAMRHEFEREPFDVLYVHNTFHAWAAVRSGLPVRKVWAFHAPAPREIALDVQQRKYGALTPFARPLIRRVRQIERAALRGFDHIRTASPFMMDQLLELYPETEGRVRSVIPLMVDTERFRYVERPRDVRAKLGLPEDRKILLTVRRLVARMGLDDLILAMAGVARRHPEALLLISGKGYLRGELEALVAGEGLQEHVRLLGFVSEEDLPSLYGAADLFVLPTAHLEGFGLVTLEAMSCGTPVLATPVGANASVVGPWNPDMLTQCAGADALAEAIPPLLEGDGLGAMRVGCRNYCETNFSRPMVAERLEAALAGSR
jgi:glycosyltransferase involved in cell wall biosynthesis